MYRIMIVDDEPLILAGIASLLNISAGLWERHRTGSRLWLFWIRCGRTS